MVMLRRRPILLRLPLPRSLLHASGGETLVGLGRGRVSWDMAYVCCVGYLYAPEGFSDVEVGY